MDFQETKILIFNLNGENFAADIMEIERILDYTQPTRMPNLNDFIEGVRNYEGGILPIVNLNKKFSMKVTDINPDSKVIVVKDDDAKVGMVVDFVSEVRDVSAENIEKAPAIVAKISDRYIKGLIKIDGKIVIYLNLSKILSSEEKASL
ncbi:chemotaxis protein CheW [Clostridium frigidicarnis]|uniref:Purine-binding chemotaxis protein CheW n=1 Tax=Clostridium frigidicarnis TaxID=84698 RepID=A0A1I0ZDJ3_9CLOT|nr:chemotaxis protein CheW [Clostridium frigidicarnis]SFB23186.1 purine-binding chemotaxis protein CheW [Clostridium frigidicarnis]